MSADFSQHWIVALEWGKYMNEKSSVHPTVPSSYWTWTNTGFVSLAFPKAQNRITIVGPRPSVCDINHVTVLTGTVAVLKQFLTHQGLTSLVRPHTLATPLSLWPSSAKHSSRNLNWLYMFNWFKQSWTSIITGQSYQFLPIFQSLISQRLWYASLQKTLLLIMQKWECG